MKGRSQLDLANPVGTTQQQIHKLETSKRTLSAYWAQRPLRRNSIDPASWDTETLTRYGLGLPFDLGIPHSHET